MKLFLEMLEAVLAEDKVKFIVLNSKDYVAILGILYITCEDMVFRENVSQLVFQVPSLLKMYYLNMSHFE